eukprot:10096-Pyramimonas_sp.AAC.1
MKRSRRRRRRMVMLLFLLLLMRVMMTTTTPMMMTLAMTMTTLCLDRHLCRMLVVDDPSRCPC